MKNKNISAAILAGTFLATGCSPTSEKSEANSQTITKQIDKDQDTADDAALDLKVYTFEQKAEFMTAMNKRQAELEIKIEEISASVEKSSDKVKLKAVTKLAALREYSAQLNKQIGEIAKATPTTWESIRTETEKACLSVKDAVEASDQWLSEKV